MKTYSAPFYRLIGMMMTLFLLLSGQALLAQAVQVKGVVKTKPGNRLLGLLWLKKAQ